MRSSATAALLPCASSTSSVTSVAATFCASAPKASSRSVRSRSEARVAASSLATSRPKLLAASVCSSTSASAAFVTSARTCSGRGRHKAVGRGQWAWGARVPAGWDM